MQIALPDFAKKAIDMLNGKNFEAYIVGGCVRDCIMGITPNDWDITTSASPEEIGLVFKDFKTIKTGIKHGTVTVLIEDNPLEITTYRIDGKYSDNRHPDKVKFTKNLKEDLLRRDFTINSLAYHYNTGVIDFFGGIKDIERKIIRCVGEGDKRFSEDALRIMRALRFSSTLGFSIHQNTKNSIHKNFELLEKISPERIYSELSKLLCGNNAKEVLMEFKSVIAKIIPEIEKSFSFNQKTPYHIYDVYEHTVNSVANIDPDLILRLTMFFHDIGKPYCFTVDENGQGHFKGHSKISVKICEDVLRRLKCDNNTIEEVTTLIKYHDTVIENDEKLIKRWFNRISPEGFFKLLKIKMADTLSQNPIFDRSELIDKLYISAKDILKKKECFSISSLKINGDDLISLGMKEGKEIGDTLNFLLDAVIDKKCINERQSLLNFYLKK